MHKSRRASGPLFWAFALFFSSTLTLAAELPPVTSKRLAAGNEAANEWLTYGGNYANWRYSPLKNIARGNVGKLVPAWVLQTGIQGQVAASPVVADGTLYFTAAYNNLYALDAVTGQMLWHYEHPMPSDLRRGHRAEGAARCDHAFTAAYGVLVELGGRQVSMHGLLG